MNEPEKSPPDETLQDRLLESLLTSATQPEDHTDRIARAMSQLEADQVAPTIGGPTSRRTWILRWGSLGAAAAALLAVFLLIQTNGTQAAMAAVERSLSVANQRTTRKYLLQVEYRTGTGGTRVIDNDLYVQGNDRFALRHPGLLPGTSFWMGRDGDESWALPAFGPVLTGDNTALGRWLRTRKEMNTPYLHVTTVLSRMMSRGYRLKTLSDEAIAGADGILVDCRRIRAQQTTADQPNLPHTIELWASRESGMAVRLVARWKPEDGAIGKESIVLMLQNEAPSLPKDWFSANAHYKGFRPIQRFDAQDNGSTTNKATGKPSEDE